MIKTKQARAWKPFRMPIGLISFAGGVGCTLAILVILAVPTLQTLTFLGGALVLLFSVITLGKMGSKTRILAIRVRPELALLVISSVLALIGCEIGLRLLLPLSFPSAGSIDHLGKNLGYRFDSTLGWFPAANRTACFTAQNPISIFHNSDGFRDTEPKPTDKPCIVFLGDSFVWGFNIEAKDRFTDKLQARHPEWRVCNWGVCGYSTDQEYLLLQKHFAEYKPRLVVLIFCVENDDDGNCSNSGGGVYFKPYFVEDPTEGLSLRNVPVPRSERVLCLEHPLVAKLYLARLAVRAYVNVTVPTPKPHVCPTKALLRAMQQFLVAHEAEFIVGLTDSAPDLEAFLLERRIAHISLKTDLRIQDDVHWNPEGHTFVAERLEALLSSNEDFLRP